VFVKAAARVNNRAENSHQPTRERERRMRGFPDRQSTHEGWLANHKRIWRLYSMAGLSVRRRKRKRIAAVERMPRPQPTGPNQSWSMDFVADGLAHGRRFRCLNVVDDYNA
jgi:transposase InsO family protein